MELIVKPRNEEELRFVQSVLNRMKIKNELRETDVKKRRKQQFLDSLEGTLRLNRAKAQPKCGISGKIMGCAHYCFFYKGK